MVAPLTQPAAIVRWFKAQGFIVKQKPNGMPLVWRAHFESLMSIGNEEEQKPDDMTTMPDAAALIARFQKGVGYGHGKTTQK